MSMVIFALACILAGSSTGADTYYINQQQIRIPISVDPARRNEIKEIHLFVSSDEGKSWNQQAVASPEQDAFSFFAPRDGIFWFSVCVVNQQNQREPNDPYSAPPHQKIVIDTMKPALRIRTADRQGDDVAVTWEIQDDHPDWASLRVEYRAAGAAAHQWIPSPATPSPNGQTRFRPTIPGPITVRVQVQDLAGSFATAEADVMAGANANMQLTSAPPAAINPVTAPATTAQQLPSVSPDAQAPTAPPPAPFTPGGPPNSSTAPPNRLVATSDTQATVGSPPQNPTAARTTRAPVPNLSMTNNRQLTLDYEVTKVGPSGIGRVELWVTRDDGKTWQKFAENPELKPPMKVDLPGEGQYGFRLVLHSRAGRGQPAPMPGAIPEMRLELDTTSPTAELFRPEPDAKQPDALVLSWNAVDRNLSPNPITLQWCEKLGQDWQTIVADYPNEGKYAWKLPPNVPYLVYLRLITHDTAGNSSMAETAEPICIDLKEPEGRLIGIAGGARPTIGSNAPRPQAPTPNIAVPASFEKSQ